MSITLRQSSIKSWLYCRAQYYAQYVLGVPLGLGNLNLEFGTMFHSEVENYHRGKAYNEDLISGYIKHYEPVGDPEVSFEFKIDDIRFTGMVDLMLPDETRDLKTSSTSYSQTKIDHVLGATTTFGYDGTGLQATAYTYWRYLQEGNIYPFTFVIYRKDKPLWTPERRIQQVTTTRTEQDMHIFEQFVRNIASQIEQETEYICSCNDKEHQVWQPTLTSLTYP